MTYAFAFQLTVDLPNAFGFFKDPMRFIHLTVGLTINNDVTALTLQQVLTIVF